MDTENGSKHAGRAARVLLIEDHEPLGRVLEKFLKHAGHEVRVARDQAGALAAAVEWLPDVVVTDLRLASGSGWGVVAALRADERTRRCPIIVSSATGPEAHTDEPMLREVEAYLRKPFDPEYLLGVVLGVLGGGGVAGRGATGPGR